MPACWECPGRVLLEILLPIPADGAGNMALIVGCGVHVDLDQADTGGIEVFGGPLG